MTETLFIRVNKLEWDYRTGGVVTVHWDMVATDGTLEGVDAKKTTFDPNPESSNFIPVEDITEEIVVSWLENTILEEQMDIYRERAVDRLRRSKLPPLVSGKPWEMS